MSGKSGINFTILAFDTCCTRQPAANIDIQPSSDDTKLLTSTDPDMDVATLGVVEADDMTGYNLGSSLSPHPSFEMMSSDRSTTSHISDYDDGFQGFCPTRINCADSGTQVRNQLHF